MSNVDLDRERLGSEFVERAGIDVVSDVGELSVVVRLAEVNEAGNTTQHFTDGGSDFHFMQLEYLDPGTGDVIATRMVAEILPGNRTELAYWAQAAPYKILKVHKGRGDMVTANPKTGEVTTVPYDAQDLPDVVLPSGTFYTLRAAPDSTESLFISGLYTERVDWDKLELVVEPGQTTIDTPDGTLEIPAEFSNL